MLMPQITIIFMNMERGETHQVVTHDGVTYTVFLNARCEYKTLKKAYENVLRDVLQSITPGETPPDYRQCYEQYLQQFEDKYRSMQAQSRRYSRWPTTTSEENERNLRIHEEHKADPDW